MPRILFISPLGSGQSATNVIGGNRLLSAESASELRQRGFDLECIDTSGDVTNLPAWRIQAARLMRFLRVFGGATRKIRRCQLAFLVLGANSATLLASSLWIVCALARRPLVLRFSGSELHRVYRGYGPAARWLAKRAWLRSALIYVETRRLRQDFGNPANFRWFPNTRNVSAPPSVRPAAAAGAAGKLLFIARLEMDKGLAEALEACRGLPEHCHLRVFGPGMSNTDFSLFDDHPRASYGGVLEPAEVPRVLVEHDLLLFPSRYDTEGYPGIIIEAFQCGLPVIATRCGEVPELVKHEENGLLVAPRSAAALRAAIERLLGDPALRRRLSKGATRQGERFRSANWHGRMASDLRRLCRRTGAGGGFEPFVATAAGDE